MGVGKIQEYFLLKSIVFCSFILLNGIIKIFVLIMGLFNLWQVQKKIVGIFIVVVMYWGYVFDYLCRINIWKKNQFYFSCCMLKLVVFIFIEFFINWFYCFECRIKNWLKKYILYCLIFRYVGYYVVVCLLIDGLELLNVFYNYNFFRVFELSENVYVLVGVNIFCEVIWMKKCGNIW